MIIVQKESKTSKKKNVLIVLTIIIFIFIGVLSFFLFPKIYLNGKQDITLNLEEKYKEQGAKAKEFGKDISDKISISGDVDSSKVGTYKIEYKIKKFGLTFSKIRYVKIIDNVAPTITLKGDNKVVLCPKSNFEEAGYSATDNYDGDITAKVQIKEEKDKIVYSVEDKNGNKTETTRELIFEDKIKPEITLKGSKNIYLKVNSQYKEEGYEVKDNCDSNLSDSIKITNNVDTSKIGDYKIEYTVSDTSGNTATVFRNVYVRKDITKKNGSGVIYLTFDDGPSASITPKILDILKKKNVKATFFVINHDNSLNYLIKRAYDEGHTIGLHSYTHNYKLIYSSVDNYFNDLNKISNKVYKITGQRTKFIRFPGGLSNTISRKYSKGIMTTLSKKVVDQGYKYYDWNIGSGDSGEVKTKEAVYNNVVKNLSHKRVNMVLMHDFENNYKTLNALSDIIDYGLKNGYEFRAIDDSTEIVSHRPNN